MENYKIYKFSIKIIFQFADLIILVIQITNIYI